MHVVERQRAENIEHICCVRSCVRMFVVRVYVGFGVGGKEKGV